MPKPGEHKTVQTRILKYARQIGWALVSGTEAEARRGFEGKKGDEKGGRSLVLKFSMDEVFW